MNFTTHEIGFESLDTLADLEALCLFLAEDVRPLPALAGFLDWRLCGGLSRVLKEGFFTGVRGDTLLFPSNCRIATPRIFAVGIGRVAEITPASVASSLAASARMLGRAGVGSVALEIPGAGKLGDEQRADAVIRHFLPNFKGTRVAVLAERGVRVLLQEAAR